MQSVTPNEIKVQVISLVGSTERRAAMLSNLSSFKISWDFFDACAGETDIGLFYHEEKALKYFGRPLSNSEIGCFKSHYTVIKNFNENCQFNWLIVFEDDVMVDPAFDFCSLTQYLSDKNYDFVRLFCRRWKSAEVLSDVMNRQIIRFRTDPYGTQAYILSKRAAAAILKNIGDIRRPIDDEYGRFWEHGFSILGLFPFPVLEISCDSTIENSRQAIQADKQTSPYVSSVRFFYRTVDKIRKINCNIKSNFL